VETGIQFQTVDKEQIKKLIEKELKGKPFEETLYSPLEGIVLDPIYTTEETLKSTWVSPNLENRICFQSFSLDTDANQINQAILEALMNGVSGLILTSSENRSDYLFSEIFKEVRFDYIHTHFAIENSLIETKFENYIDSLKYVVDPQRISFKNSSIYGCSVHISANDFVDNSLSILNLIDSNSTIPSIIFIEMTGDYFFDIAKVRALKILIHSSIQLKGQENITLFIGETSDLNMTTEKIENNILRSTTEAMSALIASADGVWIKPFDYKLNPNNEFSRRIARNVFNILIEESYLDKVIDPSSGSYYIENYTKKIAQLVHNKIKKQY
jgi:methylmalonyl-CoA mutase